jgi:Interferon-induced 6-16 family
VHRLPQKIAMTKSNNNLGLQQSGRAGVGVPTVVAHVTPKVVTGFRFKDQGIACGSVAATMMSKEATLGKQGGVASCGLVSTLQSVGAVGSGTAAKEATRSEPNLKVF